MLFRAAWARQALPLRRQVFTPLARRSVTTDAATAHAENIPQVGVDPFNGNMTGKEKKKRKHCDE